MEVGKKEREGSLLGEISQATWPWSRKPAREDGRGQGGVPVEQAGDGGSEGAEDTGTGVALLQGTRPHFLHRRSRALEYGDPGLCPFLASSASLLLHQSKAGGRVATLTPIVSCA